jgi:hypothetical protein
MGILLLELAAVRKDTVHTDVEFMPAFSRNLTKKDGIGDSVADPDPEPK